MNVNSRIRYFLSIKWFCFETSIQTEGPVRAAQESIREAENHVNGKVFLSFQLLQFFTFDGFRLSGFAISARHSYNFY